MWSSKALAALEQSLRDAQLLPEPLVVCEIGGRKPERVGQGAEPFYWLSHKRVILFEPDAEEAERLQNYYGSSDGIVIVPVAVAGENAERQFYLTKQRSCSSLYPPNEEIQARFSGLDGLTVERVESVRTKTLDWVCESHGLPRIDLLKMDVQGAEREIIEGGRASLSDTLAIVTEASFLPLYKGQPLFAELHQSLSRLGFEIHSRLTCGTRPIETAVPGRKQEIWADFLYFRSPVGLSNEALARMALVAAVYECHHLVVHALKKLNKDRAASIASSYLRQVEKAERRRNSRLRQIVRLALQR